MTADACNLCGSKDFRPLLVNHDRMFRKEKEYRLVRCASCGLIRQEPIPTQQEIESFYPKTYYSLSSGMHKKAALALARIRQGQGWKDRIIAVLSSPLFRIWFNRTLPPCKGKMRLLDVGCGDGAFLSIAKKLGFEVYGVEPSDFNPALSQEEGFTIYKGPLDGAGFGNEFFDVVTINHVLEHTTDPAAMFADVKRIVKPGGFVIIAVPNMRSLGFRFFGKYWQDLDTPRHIYLFSIPNLIEYGRKSGLKVEKLNFNGLPDSYKNSVRYLLEEKLGKPFEYPPLIRKLLTIPLFIPAELANVLGFGEYVEIVFRK